MDFHILAGLLILTQVSTSAGETCTKSGKEGTCLPIRECPSALAEMRSGITPVKCKTKRKVCCVTENNEKTTAAPVNILPDNSPIVFPSDELTSCKPLASNITARKIGKKAWDKCVDYQESLIYPCVEGILSYGPKTRADYCKWKPSSLIISGEDAYVGEFPHMALVGYGTEVVEWMCGGVIVSEKFILTAGHCVYSRSKGPVTKVKIGILRRSEPGTELNEYNVGQVHKCPEYAPPKVYNDIALLETDRPMQLHYLAVPACLHDGRSIEDETGIVTGWGTTVAKKRAEAEYLQKVTLTKFSDDECTEKFYTNKYRHMNRGFDRVTQICYGDRNTSKDSCQGDSGGPIQIKHPQVYCMYSVFGIISWGKWCGVPGEPGVYTRISHFLPWIESVVWPGE